MPKTVVFPKVEPYYLFERDCIAFPALVDGTPVRCLVSLEALIQRFGAKGRSQPEAIEAFRKHREEVEKISRQLIQERNADDRNEVLIRSLSKPPAASFVVLSIPERVRNDARLDELVAEASAILAETLVSSRTLSRPPGNIPMKRVPYFNSPCLMRRPTPPRATGTRQNS